MLRRTATRNPEKTAFLVPGKDGFDSVSYRELFDLARKYAAVLRHFGLQRGDRCAILSENCPEWAYVDWSLQCLGVELVPIYPTLPADQVAYILNDSGAKLVVGGSPDQLKKTTGFASALLKGSDDSLDAVARSGKFTIHDRDWTESIDAVGPEDVATIIYTSGTTGKPKGAMLPHRAIIHVCECAEREIKFREDDTFLCFLPMSHVYERVAGQALPVHLGATVAFAKSLASLAGDMLKARPTIMLCVPRFLESLKDRISDGISKQPPFRRRLAELAISQGVRRARGQFAPLYPILDKVVLTKLRERTGGRLRFFVSGGAALAPSVAEFYMALGLVVLQGYGLTETSGGTCINRVESNKYWTVGPPLDMEIQIAPDGEILIRGAALMKGYYNLPEETAQAIDAEGWFHTGDIGEFEGKNLKITDRKKDLLVLGNGKNVAPQPIENKLKASPFIAEAVVLGDGMEYLIALVVPNFEAVRRELKVGDDVVLSASAEAKSLMKREIDAVNKTVAPFEMVKKHVILDRAFSIENDELTPSLKVKRKVVKERYADAIASMQRT